MTRAHPLRPNPRIVILSSDSPHHRYLAMSLARSGLLAAVIVEPGRAQCRQLWRQRRLRSWFWRFYQDLRNRATLRNRYAQRLFAGLEEKYDAPRFEVEWVNSPESYRLISCLAPDLIVVCGTSYIHAGLLATVPLAINVHGGWLPDYKGNHGVFFAYAAGDFVHAGASLHLVTAELDGGDLVGVVRPRMGPHHHDGHLYYHAVRDAIDLLCRLVVSGEPIRSAEQTARGIVYRHRDRTPAKEFGAWWRRRVRRVTPPDLPAAQWVPAPTDPGGEMPSAPGFG